MQGPTACGHFMNRDRGHLSISKTLVGHNLARESGNLEVSSIPGRWKHQFLRKPVVMVPLGFGRSSPSSPTGRVLGGQFGGDVRHGALEKVIL